MLLIDSCHYFKAQHFLYFLPLPQGHGSFRPTFSTRTGRCLARPPPSDALVAVSAAAVTTLSAIFLYTYAGAQLFVGLLADRFGGMRVLLAGGLLMSVGAVTFPLSDRLWSLYASRAMVGLGASFMYLSIVKDIDTLFGPRSFAPLLGVLVFTGYAGGLVGTLPFERAARAVGWRQALLAVGILTSVSLVCVSVLLRRFRHRPAGRAGLSLRPLWDVAMNVRSLPVLFSGSMNWSLYFVVQATVGKKFLEDFAGMGSAQAAACLFTMTLAAMGVVFAAGFVSRLMGDRRKPLIMGAAMTMLVAAMLLLDGVYTRASAGRFVACYVMLAVSSGISCIYIASMKELNRSDAVALSTAVLNFTAYGAVAVLANVAGVVLDRFTDRAVVTDTATIYPPDAYAALFLLIAVLAALSAMSAAFIPETRGIPADAPDPGRARTRPPDVP